mgnify:FL=1|tara:strand:+ start:488 stop:670 length:183 start_codon:yes stop_codon:yes gene_type:complete
MSWWQSIKNFLTPLSKEQLNPEDYEVVRARSKKGTYIADDKSTPDVNEAYVKVKKTKSKK